MRQLKDLINKTVYYIWKDVCYGNNPNLGIGRKLDATAHNIHDAYWSVHEPLHLDVRSD